MLQYFRNLTVNRRSEEGASAVEYGLLVSLIAAVIVVAVLALGGTLKGIFNDTDTKIQTPADAISVLR